MPSTIAASRFFGSKRITVPAGNPGVVTVPIRVHPQGFIDRITVAIVQGTPSSATLELFMDDPDSYDASELPALRIIPQQNIASTGLLYTIPYGAPYVVGRSLEPKIYLRLSNSHSQPLVCAVNIVRRSNDVL